MKLSEFQSQAAEIKNELEANISKLNKEIQSAKEKIFHDQENFNTFRATVEEEKNKKDHILKKLEDQILTDRENFRAERARFDEISRDDSSKIHELTVHLNLINNFIIYFWKKIHFR